MKSTPAQQSPHSRPGTSTAAVQARQRGGSNASSSASRQRRPMAEAGSRLAMGQYGRSARHPVKPSPSALDMVAEMEVS